jgi:hypothetical protein
MVFSFWNNPRCLSSEIFAGRLDIPDTIIEKVTIEIVLWPFARAAYSGGTWRRKTKTASSNQMAGQAITQKRAGLLIKLSFKPFIYAAEIWFTI